MIDPSIRNFRIQHFINANNAVAAILIILTRVTKHSTSITGNIANDENIVSRYAYKNRVPIVLWHLLLTKISLCNHLILYALASQRPLISSNDHMKTYHLFKYGLNTRHPVVLYALVSPQCPHTWFFGRVRTIRFPATKLCPCVNKLSGSMLSVRLCNSLGRPSVYSGHVDYTGWKSWILRFKIFHRYMLASILRESK